MKTSFGVLVMLTSSAFAASSVHEFNLPSIDGGFPANDFGAQEPGTNEEIRTFCTRNYHVTFPMYSKISVKGSGKAPLYKFLTESAGGEVQWDFTKFLVDGNGKVISWFDSAVEPDSSELIGAVQKALQNSCEPARVRSRMYLHVL